MTGDALTINVQHGSHCECGIRQTQKAESAESWIGEGFMVRECGVETNTWSRMAKARWGGALAACVLFVSPASAQAPANAGTFTMEQVIAYPFVPELDSAEKGDAIAFVRVVKGVRN